MMYSRTERVFILEHYFSSKSFAAVREAFSNARKFRRRQQYTDLIKFRDIGSFVSGKCLSSDKTDEMTAAPISSSASAAITGYGCYVSVF
jgi:hypothetical protein